MKLVAIICEFNPLHKGHEYLIKEAKRVTGADGVVCIMSGNFVQRAEPSIADMRIRAKAVLKCGAVAVLTIPTLYSTACAERFSEGAINIANSIDAIKWLLFGSECGDIEYIKQVAKVQANESEDFKASLKQFLSEGLPYPKALSLASSKILGGDSDAPNMPNDILGIEYCKQLIRTSSKIEPITIKRLGANHHDEKLNKNFSSSTAVRGFLNDGNLSKVGKALSKRSFEVFNEAWQENMIDFKLFEQLVLYALRTKDLSLCPDSGEGLEVKLKKESERFLNLSEVIEAVKSKRYTHARIRRLCLQALLDITHYPQLNDIKLPSRLLGIKKSLKKKILPLLPNNIIIKNKDEKSYLALLNNNDKKTIEYILNICTKANSIYSLVNNSTKNHLEEPLLIV